MATEDWKDAARADLLTQLEAQQGIIQEKMREEEEARLMREEAEERLDNILKAAATLGILLGGKPSPGPGNSQATPPAREIVLEALRAAYPKPMKAAQLRGKIEERMGRSIHPKTPGMTLNRLAGDRLVRREGHSWFAVMQDAQGEGDDRQGSLVNE